MGRRNFIISLIIYENRNVVKLDVPNLESTLKYSVSKKISGVMGYCSVLVND